MDEKDFIKKWIAEIGDLLKKFPDDFIDKNKCENFSMPGRLLVPGTELFGSYEILDSEGNPQFQVNDYSKLKYILYANKLKPSEILIPKEISEIISSVKNYESHIDSFLHAIEKEYKSVFPGEKNFNEVSQTIFSTLNIHRY